MIKRCRSALGFLSLVLAAGCAPSASAPESASGPAAADLRPRLFPRLPYDLSRIENQDAVGRLPAEARAGLAANGFVVVGPTHGDMARCYREPDEPWSVKPFVTVDSVLEVFLKDLERAWGRMEAQQGASFAKLQAPLWSAVWSRCAKLPAGPARRAGLRLLGLVSVGRSLADPEWPGLGEAPAPGAEPALKGPDPLPEGVDAEAFRAAWKADLDAVLKGEGRSDSALWKRPIDWSAFKPVGPYAGDAELQRYYRLCQWWGAQGLRAAEPEERLMAAILAWAVLEPVRFPVIPRSVVELRWELERFGRLYDLFLGKSDDVPLDFLMTREFKFAEKNLRIPEDLGTEAFDKVLVELFKQAPAPRVPSEWDMRDALDPARRHGQGVRLLPARPTPESMVFARTTADLGRLLPRGLDFLAALGDDRARAHTLALEPAGVQRRWLADRLDALRKPEGQAWIAEGQPELQRSLCRLYLAMASLPKDERVPLFMRTEAYHDRGLAAALAVSAQLQEIVGPHRRVLGRFGGMGKADMPGLADPNLEAWQRLIELWHAASSALAEADVRLPETSLDVARSFSRIAAKQLRGDPLASDEASSFLLYGAELGSRLRATDLDQDRDANRKPDRRVCVALARSTEPDAVRWAGRGVCRIYAVVERDGKLYLCQGGVFDYREFDLPPGRALDREEFRKLMDAPAAPKSPDWTKSYRVEPAVKPAPGGTESGPRERTP
jgi:hypothetical protein